MLPEAADIRVWRRAFGDTVGFAVGWTDWITYCAVLGYVSIAIGEFTALIRRRWAGRKGCLDCGARRARGSANSPIAVSSRFQEITKVVKFGAFLTVVVAALVFAPGIRSGSALASQSPSLSGLIVALQSVVIQYGGWQSATYFSEEDRDPDRETFRGR